MKGLSFTAALLLLPTVAWAAPPPVVGPLQTKNALAEIAANGSAAQAAALANLGALGAGSIGTSVAPLVAGLVPVGNIPPVGALGGLVASNSLSDVASAAAARANIGLGSLATQSAAAAAITGGTVDSATLGGVTPLLAATTRHMNFAANLITTGSPTATNTWAFGANALLGTIAGAVTYAPMNFSYVDGIVAPNAFVSPLWISEAMGTGYVGARAGIQFNLNIDVAPGAGATIANTGFTGLTLIPKATVNVGGTAPTDGSAMGSMWGYNDNVSLRAGATNWNAIFGAEHDVTVEAGASVAVKSNSINVLLSGDRVQGNDTDASYVWVRGGAPGSPGWRRILSINTEGAQSPLDPVNGVVLMMQPNTLSALAYPTHQVRGRTLIDANAWVGGEGLIEAPGFLVDPNGNTATQSLSLNGVDTMQIGASGLTIAPTGNHVATAAVISAGGSNVIAGDVVKASNGLYKIIASQVQGAVMALPGSGGTPGACTLTGTTGTGTRFQATGTVLSNGTIANGTNLTITVPGNYTAAPTNPQTEPVTSTCGLNGATVTVQSNAVSGAITTMVPATGTTTPATIVSTIVTHAQGVGPTLTMTWGGVAGGLTLSHATVITPNLPTADPHVVGQWWKSGSTLTISGG